MYNDICNICIFTFQLAFQTSCDFDQDAYISLVALTDIQVQQGECQDQSMYI